MKKDDLIILLIALLLVTGMLATIFFGGEKSKHGVGGLLEKKPEQQISQTKDEGLDLCQRQAQANHVSLLHGTERHII